MIERRRLRQPPHVIEHDLRRQALQQVGILDDLVAAHVDLHMPAEIGDALGQRLDHVDRHRRARRIEHREADAANARIGHRAKLAVGDGRVHHRDAARVGRPETLDRVGRHAVVGDVGRGRHDHGARRADARLQQLVLIDRSVALHARLRPRPRRRKAVAVIDVHVAVAGVRRRLELGRFAAVRVWHRVLRLRRRAGRQGRARACQKCPTSHAVHRSCVASPCGLFKLAAGAIVQQDGGAADAAKRAPA